LLWLGTPVLHRIRARRVNTLFFLISEKVVSFYPI
jgi:hypothetical protein